MAADGSRLRQLGAWLIAPPDEAFADAARAGELLVGRIRTWATLLLLTSPIVSILLDGEVGQNILGLGVAAAAAVIAILIEQILQRGFYRPSIAFMTSIFDVSIISAGLFVYWAVGNPIVTTNSRVIFECYFLAIGASALRYDHRVTVVAGLMAIAQYVGLAAASWARYGKTTLLVESADYGRFDWSSIFSRCVVLLAMMFVSLAIVSRARRLRSLSTNDRLTGMFNRAYIEEYLGHEVLRTARANGALAIAMLDVDRFKGFNDKHGHAAGDAALKQVAKVIQSELRRTDVVARYGGEEILIVLPATSLPAAMDKLDVVRVQIAIADITLPRGGIGHVTVSIGVAAWGQDGRAVDALLDLADKRLYAAKDAGRNRVFGPAQMVTIPQER